MTGQTRGGTGTHGRAPRTIASALLCCAAAGVLGPTYSALAQSPAPSPVQPPAQLAPRGVVLVSPPGTADVALAAAVLRGVIVDHDSARGLPGAGVLLLDAAGEPASKVGRTDSLGRFEVEAPGAGAFRVLVRRQGYPTVISGPLTVVTGELVELEIPLAVGGVAREEATILTRDALAEEMRLPEAFVVRRASGAGISIGPDALRPQARRGLADLLRREAGSWWRAPERGGCRPSWLVNGRPSESTEEQLLRLTSVELRAVEVLRTAAEAEAAGLAAPCGAVVVWLR